MLALDDKQSLTRTLQGETDAFGGLVEKYHSRLYTFLLGKVKDAEVAKDLCQETWLKAFRTIGSFRGDSAFYSWLYRIANNTCIDYFRKQKHHRLFDPLHLIDDTCIRDTHPCPSREIERAELRAHLKNGIAALPPQQRRVFHLYYLHELPIKAISKRLNKSEGTIKTHLRNARLQLQASLMSYLKTETS